MVEWPEAREPLITLDIDWAPEFVIDWVAQRLIDANVRATWLVTHESRAVDRLRRRSDLFELGIHPNFMAGSSHGATAIAVLRHCLDLVPEAISMRTHGLVQSTELLDLVLAHTTIRADLSLFLPHTQTNEMIHYWGEDRELVRIPYIWEDDFEMRRPNPVWRVDALVRSSAGFAVLDFHPIHVYLNQPDPQAYDVLKRRCGKLTAARQNDADDLIGHGEGPRTMFESVLDRLQAHSGKRITDLVATRQTLAAKRST